MTQQNTMPAVLYLGVTHDHKDCLSCEAYYSSSYIDGFEGPTGKYIRAEHVEELLKQARLMIVELCHDHILFEDANKIITAIDKFLGGE